MTAVTYHLGSMGGVMLLTMPLWLLLRTLWQVRKEQSPRWGRELLLALFVLFLLIKIGMPRFEKLQKKVDKRVFM